MFCTVKTTTIERHAREADRAAHIEQAELAVEKMHHRLPEQR